MTCLHPSECRRQFNAHKPRKHILRCSRCAAEQRQFSHDECKRLAEAVRKAASTPEARAARAERARALWLDPTYREKQKAARQRFKTRQWEADDVRRWDNRMRVAGFTAPQRREAIEKEMQP